MCRGMIHVSDLHHVCVVCMVCVVHVQGCDLRMCFPLCVFGVCAVCCACAGV